MPYGTYIHTSPPGEWHKVTYTSYDKVLWAIHDWAGCVINVNTGEYVTIKSASKASLRVFCSRAVTVQATDAGSHAQMFHLLLWHIACLATSAE